MNSEYEMFQRFKAFMATEQAAPRMNAPPRHPGPLADSERWMERVSYAPTRPSPAVAPVYAESVSSGSSHRSAEPPPPRGINWNDAMRNILQLTANQRGEHRFLWDTVRKTYAEDPESTIVIGEGHHGADGRFYFSVKQTVFMPSQRGAPYRHTLNLHIYGKTRGTKFMAESVDIFIPRGETCETYLNAAVFPPTL